MGLFSSKKSRLQEALAKGLMKQILGAKSVSRTVGKDGESFMFDNYQYDFCVELGDERGVRVFKNGDLLYAFDARVQPGAVVVDKTAYNIFNHLLTVCRQEYDKANEKTVKKSEVAKEPKHKKSEIELLKHALEKIK